MELCIIVIILAHGLGRDIATIEEYLFQRALLERTMGLSAKQIIRGAEEQLLFRTCNLLLRNVQLKICERQF